MAMVGVTRHRSEGGTEGETMRIVCVVVRPTQPRQHLGYDAHHHLGPYVDVGGGKDGSICGRAAGRWANVCLVLVFLQGDGRNGQ